MRIVLVITAALLALACALYPMTVAEVPLGLLVLGGAGFVAIALALATSEWVLAGPAAGLIVIVYALALAESGRALDWSAAVFGVALLVVLELVDAAPVVRRDTDGGRRVAALHVGHVAVVAFVGAVTALGTSAAAVILGGGPTPLVVVAALCGAAGIALVVALAVRGVAASD